MAETVYLLLGSNMGNREQHLDNAIEKLSLVEGLEIIATSPVYVTEPMEVDDDQPSFLNQVIKGEFEYTPLELLRETEKIETTLGRTDKTKRRPRTIDIDVLLFGDRVINTDSLEVPHPRLTERPFALIPLLAVDADARDPRSGEPLASFVNDTDSSGVLLYRDHVSRNI